MAENSGPLDEIQFWKDRCSDLTGISKQLDKSGVKKITEILTCIAAEIILILQSWCLRHYMYKVKHNRP
jgi:hypothetical protein